MAARDWEIGCFISLSLAAPGASIYVGPSRSALSDRAHRTADGQRLSG
jgi:hypothetical protein